MWPLKRSTEESSIAVVVPTGPLPDRIINQKDGAELVLVSAGPFLRGSLEGQGEPDERPQREIYLDVYYIALRPVTNGQYRKFIEATGRPAPHFWNDSMFNQDDQPVVGVSWLDAEAYCEWGGLRLPSEAEWEKAAGWDDAQKLKRWWPWGDTEPDPERANYARNIGRPTPVGQFPLGASAYGCLDMAGNVWEWCQDYYLYSYYETSPDRNPVRTDKEPWRALRGGSWRRPSSYITATYRYWHSPSHFTDETGFRCASGGAKPPDPGVPPARFKAR